MQHQFLPDVVFVATPDTPAKMLQTAEEMVEVLAKYLPPKIEAEASKSAVKRITDGDDEPAPKAERPKPAPKAPAKEATEADVAKTRNLVTNQISSRRRGTYTRGRG